MNSCRFFMVALLASVPIALSVGCSSSASSSASNGSSAVRTDAEINVGDSLGATPPGADFAPHGRVAIVDGTSDGFQVTMLLPNGERDPAFGTNGVASIRVPNAHGHSFQHSYASVDDNGSVSVFGNLMFPWIGSNLKPHAVLARLAPDGTLDPTLDGDGLLDLAGNLNDDEFMDVVVDRDAFGEPKGYFVAYHVGGGSSKQTVRIERRDRSGKIDTSFGHAGSARTEPFYDRYDSLSPGMAASTKLDRNGSLVVAHQTYEKLPSADGKTWDARPFIYISRFTAQGQIDQSFGENGTVRLPTASPNALESFVLPLRDGSMIVRSTSLEEHEVNVCVTELRRLDRNGLQVDLFPGERDRKVEYSTIGPTLELADGRLIATGFEQSTTLDGDFRPAKSYLERWTLDGRQDVLFGEGGRVKGTFLAFQDEGTNGFLTFGTKLVDGIRYHYSSTIERFRD